MSKDKTPWPPRVGDRRFCDDSPVSTIETESDAEARRKRSERIERSQKEAA